MVSYNSIIYRTFDFSVLISSGQVIPKTFGIQVNMPTKQMPFLALIWMEMVGEQNKKFRAHAYLTVGVCGCLHYL